MCVDTQTFSPQDYEQRMASAGLQVEQTAWRPATSNELENLKTKNEKSIKVKLGTLKFSTFNINFLLGKQKFEVALLNCFDG